MYRRVRDGLGRTTLALGTHVEFYAETMKHLEHRVIAGFRAWSKRFVQALTTQSSALGDSAHAPCLCHIADCGEKNVRVSVFQRGRKILGNNLVIVEIGAGVKFFELDTHVEISINDSRKPFGTADIFGLGLLVTAAQKNDYDAMPACKINAKAGSNVNTHFANTITY